MDHQPAAAMRFQPALWTALLHLALMAAVFVLFLGRKPGWFRVQALAELVPGFYTHVFNFSLSYLLLAGVGFMWVMMGVRLQRVAWAGLALAIANIGYELWLPLLNTRDPLDAAYGVAGTLCASAWLRIVAHHGLRPAGQS